MDNNSYFLTAETNTNVDQLFDTFRAALRTVAMHGVERGSHAMEDHDEAPLLPHLSEQAQMIKP